MRDQNSAVETLSSAYFELKEIQNRLSELTNLEFFKTVLTEGEQTSIQKIIEHCEIKSELIKNIQSQVQYFPS